MQRPAAVGTPCHGHDTVTTEWNVSPAAASQGRRRLHRLAWRGKVVYSGGTSTSRSGGTGWQAGGIAQQGIKPYESMLLSTVTFAFVDRKLYVTGA